MNLSMVFLTVLLGVGATIVMDLWALILKLCGQPTLNFSLVGRWVGHMANGQFIHQPSIAQKENIPAENALGWGVHYATGIIFAFLFIFLFGETWFTSPILWPALFFGVITVVAPYFIIQPAMGAGIAASKTLNPSKARLMSLLSHGVFGLGLYLTALVLQPLLIYFL
ncbi:MULTISPECIES: DUF2938 domain-containing protein [Providencia]|uniref:DUF2938 domain-containing protein n=1 Tax=Providencia TaxID=586 RepID=UPI002349C23C|nr:DUF2938 domain-containing protein [Providencia sp. PROV174]